MNILDFLKLFCNVKTIYMQDSSQKLSNCLLLLHVCELTKAETIAHRDYNKMKIY